MRPTPAGRGGTARCCSPYNAILERLDTMDVRIQQAVDDANAAMSAAVIQAGNAAQSASDALTQAGIAAGKASDAAADAADAAQDAADAAQALSDINDTIQTTLDNELGGKVDKLTTAGLHLYSHTGATQGEEEPVDGTTSNTIPIRDGNGRMHAADPASGATDKTLVTANWVSQTGAGRPNNLIHDGGNETVGGTKTFTARPNFGMKQYVTTINSQDYIIRLFMPVTNNSDITFLQADSRSKSLAFVHIKIDITNSAITANVSNLAGTQLPGIKYYIMEKDGQKYIAMDMAYHQGYTLMVLTQADFYGNNAFYSPLVDIASDNAIEIART